MNKIIPLSGEKAILERFYGKGKKFTNAVNEMKMILRNIDKEKEEENAEKVKIAPNRNKNLKRDEKDETYIQRIENIKKNPGNIVLAKLRSDDIDKWSTSSGAYLKRKNCSQKIRTTMTLRKR